MPKNTFDNNPDVMNRLQTAAYQAGRSVEEFLTALLDQRPTQQLATDFQRYLKVIHQAGITLDQMKTLDDLYYRAVEIGFNELGFSRIGLLMYDHETNSVYGTFGIGPAGALRDERHFRESSLRDDTRLAEALSHKDHVLIQFDTDLYEFGQPIGQGWNALCVLWDGEQMLGYLAVDNLVHKQPPRPYETELLSVFGTTVAHAISRKRAELKLRASEQRFRALLQAAPVAVLMVNPAGQIVSANPAAALMFGYSVEEFDSLPLEVLLPEYLRESYREAVPRFFDDPYDHVVQVGGKDELYGLRTDGTQFPMEAALSHVETEDGPLALAFVIDSTERKVAEKQRVEMAVQEKQVAILNSFIRDTSHEFRTPLAIIHSNLFLLGKIEDETKQYELRESIDQQAKKILSLVENLTTMVRLENRAVDSHDLININSIVLGVVPSFQKALEAKKISLWLNLNEDIEVVQGISHDLALALSCLLDNAIRYTPDRGSIVLESAMVGDDHVVLSMIDNGVGMTPEIMEHIFEQFYRVDTAHSTPGLGLGLSIAKKIVEQHHGRIEVESIADAGSTFRIILPVAADGSR